MKRIKSLMCIFLIFAFMMPMYVTVYAEDGLSEEYKKSMDVLISLGIMSGYSQEDCANTVTRAEFAKMICSIIFDENSGGFWSSSSKFDDVDEQDSYFAAVHALNDMNIMIGYNHEFAPGRNITYNEAVTSLVSLLGYSVHADNNEAYPNEYLKIASQISLNKHVADKSQHELNLAETAMLLYNSLNIDLVTLTISDGKVKYEKNDGVTPLSKYMDIYEGSGLFEANSISSLYANQFNTDGYVRIDGVDYHAENFDEFLGCAVDFYYVENKGDYTIVYMEKQRKVFSIDITSYEIDGFENNSYKFTPAGESRTRTARLDAGAKILYNGRIPENLQGEGLFIPKDGKITLIDNDDNGVYDVVMIWSFETYVVKSVSTQNQFSVIDYYREDEPLVLDEDDGYKLQIIKDGQAADISTIAKWNVLSVAKSEQNGSEYLVTVIVSDRRATGVPNYNADSVTVEGEEYPLLSVFDMEKKSNTTYDFYLDFLGRAAVYDPYSSDVNTVFYGFLTGCTWDENSELHPTLKIFTEEGEFQTYLMTKKIRLDGIKYENSRELVENESVIRDAGGVRVQLIGYKLNKNKEINMIDTVDMTDVERGTESLTSTKIYPAKTINYLLLGRTFGDHIALSKNLRVFKIPLDGEGNILRDVAYEKYFESVSGEPFTDHYDSYTVQFYNVNDAGVCEMMVNYILLDGENDLKWKERIIIVDSLTYELDEEDEITVKIQGYQGKANKVSFEVNEFALDEAKKLKKGDIIQFGTDREGKIGKIYKRYSADGDNSYYLSDLTPYKMTRAVYGRVVAVDYDNNAFKTCYDNNPKDELSDASSVVSNMRGWSYDPARYDSQIMIYNRKDKSVRTADWNSVRVGQEVLIQKLETSAQSIVIFE